MKIYRVLAKQLGIGDGNTYKRGAKLREDQLTRGRIEGGLRAKHIELVGEADELPAAALVAEESPADPDDAGDAAADDDTEVEDGPASDDAAAGSDPLDAAIETLAGVDAEALAALAAAELLCVGDAVDYLVEHGSFVGIAGVGKGRDKQLQKALAQYLPAAEPEAAAA